MNLTSCDNCAVLLDKDKLEFPSIYGDNDEILDFAVWYGNDYVSVVDCPICKYPIKEENGE